MSPNELLRIGLDEEEGRVEYSVRLLQKFGTAEPYLTPEKIKELWLEYSQHDTLFSDYTRGAVAPFLTMLFDPRSIIAEIYHLGLEQPIGALMLTRILPRFDATAHFTLWDSKAPGREPIFIGMMQLWMKEFNLHRLSVEVPGVHSGVKRMIKRLGFVEEGIRREASIHRDRWVDMTLFGILRSEVESHYSENGHE